MTAVSWRDCLPVGWKAKPLRAVASYVVSNVDKKTAEGELPVRLCNYPDVYHNEFVTQDMQFMSATTTRGQIQKFGLVENDVVITKDSESWDDIGVPALVTQAADDLVCGYHLALLRPHTDEMDGSFLFRVLQAKPVRMQLELAATGVTRFGIPKSAIGCMAVPVPPLVQQRAITAYLDRETARIDASIVAKERLLSLLAEKRRALVTRAVTGGLDDSVPLSTTGIHWLRQIPAHWRVERMRFLAVRVEQGWSPPAENREPLADEWGVIKLNAVNHGRFDESAAKALPLDIQPLSDLEIRHGDLLITRSNTPSLVGDACYVASPKPRLMLCDLIYRLTLVNGVIDARFLAYFLTTPVGRCQIEMDARGTSASMVKISQEHIKDWRVPVPPFEEQRRIVALLTHKTALIDHIVTAAIRSVAVLKERRSTMIASAVTGRLDLEERVCSSLD